MKYLPALEHPVVQHPRPKSGALMQGAKKFRLRLLFLLITPPLIQAHTKGGNVIPPSKIHDFLPAHARKQCPTSKGATDTVRSAQSKVFMSRILASSDKHVLQCPTAVIGLCCSALTNTGIVLGPVTPLVCSSSQFSSRLSNKSETLLHTSHVLFFSSLFGVASTGFHILWLNCQFLWDLSWALRLCTFKHFLAGALVHSLINLAGFTVCSNIVHHPNKCLGPGNNQNIG